MRVQILQQEDKMQAKSAGFRQTTDAAGFFGYNDNFGVYLERETGLEPATSSLGRCQTTRSKRRWGGSPAKGG